MREYGYSGVPAPGQVPPGPVPVAAYPPPQQDMSQQIDMIRRQQMAEARTQELVLSAGPAYLLWFFLGIFGAHRFYLRPTGIALGQLFTLGGLGFWAFFDVFAISGRLRQVNSDIRRTVYAQYGVPIA